MPAFTVTRAYTMSPAKLRKACEQLATRLQQDYGIACEWQGRHHMVFRGKGVHGELDFADHQLALSVRLGLLAAAFEKPLRARIERYLAEHIH